MKKRILLFTSSIVLLAGTIMSYKAGPAHVNFNYSGGPGSSGTCSAAGCHGTGGVTPTSYTVVLRKASTGQIVTSGQYNPDTMYTVTMIGIQTDLTLTHFGFNLMALDSNATTVNAGTFSNFPTGVDDATLGGLVIVEHRLASIPRATNNLLEVTFNWKAPSAGMGTIGFFGILNAVNNDNSASTVDKCSAAGSDYYRESNPVSVAELNADIKINAYPNPMTDKLNISLENADNGVYSISVFDMHGKVVATQTANVNKSFSTSVNASSWAAGMYHVQLKKGDAQRTIAVVKQ